MYNVLTPMKSLPRKIISSLGIIFVLAAACAAWFYIDTSYGPQSFGFHNFNANPTLHYGLGGLDILVSLVIIVLLLGWGWAKAKPAQK